MAEDYLEFGGLKEDNLTIGAKGGVIALLLKVSSTVLGFLNQVILARILGAGGLGEILLAVSVVNISAQIAKFGMEEVMMRFIPLYIDQKDNEKLKGTIYFALKLSFLFSIVLCSILLLSSKFIAINIFHSEALLTLLPIVVVAVPAAVIRGVIGGILKGYKDATRALLPEFFISPFFRIVIFLVLIIKNVSSISAIIAFVLGEIIAVALSINFLLKELKKIGTVKLRCENKKVLDVAYTIILTSVSVLLYTQADIWILGMFTSTETVGIYGVAAKLVLLVYFPMLAFATLIPPLISSIHASGNHDELKKVVSEGTRWILSMALPIILILILEGKVILKYFFGEQFVTGYTVLLILSIGQLIKAGSGLVGVLLQMTGEHKIYMKINIFWGIVNIILNIILVPRFGMFGAAVATAFCLSMIDIVGVFVIYKRLSLLTFAYGLKFDIIFIFVVAIFYFFLKDYNQWYHFLLVVSLTVYLWKSFANNYIPWRMLFAKYRTE